MHFFGLVMRIKTSFLKKESNILFHFSFPKGMPMAV